MQEQTEQRRKQIVSQKLASPPQQKFKPGPAWGGAGQKPLHIEFPEVEKIQKYANPSKEQPKPGGSLKRIQEEEEGRLLERKKQEEKPLFVIQMEEEAIQELMMAYEAAKNFDETITVERASAKQLADPIWQAHV